MVMSLTSVRTQNIFSFPSVPSLATNWTLFTYIKFKVFPYILLSTFLIVTPREGVCSHQPEAQVKLCCKDVIIEPVAYLWLWLLRQRIVILLHWSKMIILTNQSIATFWSTSNNSYYDILITSALCSCNLILVLLW